jgi:hypothetical protein
LIPVTYAVIEANLRCKYLVICCIFIFSVLLFEDLRCNVPYRWAF